MQNDNGAEWKEAFRDHVNNYRCSVECSSEWGEHDKRENEQR